MNVSISRGGGSIVPFHNGRAVLGVVEEVEAVAALGHMDNVLAVKGVIGHRAVDGFLYPQPFAVVLERRRGAGLRHLLELTALFSGVAPGAIIRRVANGVAGHGVGCRRVDTQLLKTIFSHIIEMIHEYAPCCQGAVGRRKQAARIRNCLRLEYLRLHKELSLVHFGASFGYP